MVFLPKVVLLFFSGQTFFKARASNGMCQKNQQYVCKSGRKLRET